MQVGDGTTQDRSTPVKPTGNPRDVTFLSIGFRDTCAIQQQHLLCWGAGSGGDGSILGGEPASVPSLQAVMPDPVTRVATSDAIRCVQKADGSIWCWGMGALGYLGDGADRDSAVPVPVRSMSSGVVSFVLGTYALKDDGSVWGWGAVSGANLTSLGTDHASEPVPIVNMDLMPLTGVVQLSGSSELACARTTAAQVLCWGLLPTGGIEPQYTDVAVETNVAAIGQAITEISVGNDSICSLDAAGVVRCEGRNEFGQLGDGTRDFRFTMEPVQTLPKRATHVASGAFHTCALLEDASLWCWGSSLRGQIGVGTEEDQIRPVPIKIRQ
jgi:alpha-tubulin suppressor-like RCC1 family protein